MRVIEVSARKGGVGTTAVACGLALAIAKERPSLRVALLDRSPAGDCVGLLGVSNIGPGEVTATPGLGVSVIRTEGDKTPGLSSYDIVVVDAGVTRAVGQYDGQDAYTVAVVRNEYLSLRAEVATSIHPNATVACLVAERALTYGDIQMVLGKRPNLAQWEVTPVIARAIDAGLYEYRSESIGCLAWVTTLIPDFFATVTA